MALSSDNIASKKTRKLAMSLRAARLIRTSKTCIVLVNKQIQFVEVLINRYRTRQYTFSDRSILRRDMTSILCTIGNNRFSCSYWQFILIAIIFCHIALFKDSACKDIENKTHSKENDRVNHFSQTNLYAKRRLGAESPEVQRVMMSSRALGLSAHLKQKLACLPVCPMSLRGRETSRAVVPLA